MSKLFSNPQLLFDEIPAAGAAPTGEVTKDDMLDFLNADDDKEVIELEPEKKPDDKKEEESKKEEVKEPDELEELELELEPPTEEQLELVAPVRRKEILAKYPNLFKEFPYLEKAYYREQQFTELLPTIDDAKEAVEAKRTLDKFEQDVMSGNTETVLKAMKAESPDGFNKLVDDYLPTLARVDEQAYFHVLGNVTKHTIIAMVDEAKKSSNEALNAAAQILNQFVFGTSDFKPPTKLSKEKPADNGKETELTNRQREFAKQQFDVAVNDLNTRVNNTLKNTIDANIDPNKAMTDYVRKTASRDVLETLGALLSKDARFVAIVDKLWESAFKENFSKASTDRIKSAYLSRAKTLLPTVIKKARTEALKGIGKKVDREEETTPNKGPIPAGRPRSDSKSGKITEAKDIPKGMRTIDFLMQD